MRCSKWKYLFRWLATSYWSRHYYQRLIDTHRLMSSSESLEPIRAKDGYIISQWKLKVKTGKLPQARENASDQFPVGFNFSSFDWSRAGHKLSTPITERNKVKPKQSQTVFVPVLLSLTFAIPTFLWVQGRCKNERKSGCFLVFGLNKTKDENKNKINWNLDAIISLCYK